MNTIEGRSRPRTPPFEPANQVELVVHVVCQGSRVKPVPARQPSIRWGRYWIFFSLRLTMRTRPSRSAAAKLTMARLSNNQMPSTATSLTAEDSLPHDLRDALALIKEPERGGTIPITVR